MGETYVDVNHCLVAAQGTTKADIRRVISHPQASQLLFTQPLGVQAREVTS